MYIFSITICELTAQERNIHLKQKINEKTSLNKMKRSWGKDRVLTNKDEVKPFCSFIAARHYART
jgi:hypothetical protein